MVYNCLLSKYECMYVKKLILNIRRMYVYVFEYFNILK